MEENYGHKPVLLHECLDALAIKPDGIYVDGTLGRAGHSLEIVRRLTTGRLIALDRDETAIEAANRRLGDYMDRVTLVHSNFSALGELSCMSSVSAAWTGCSLTSAFPPRSSTKRSAAFPTSRTRRSICGWTNPPR